MIKSISSNIGSLFPASAQKPRPGRESATFRQALAATASGNPGSNDRAVITKKAEENANLARSSLEDAFATYKKEAQMSPAQRARRDILEKMKLTEDAIKAMPSEEQGATEKIISEEVARRLKLSEYGRSQSA